MHLRNPYADPTAASDGSGVPPAAVVTAGFDPLRDGGKAYAEQMEADEVSVRYRNYEDMLHGFLTLRGVESTEEAIEEVGGDLGEVFG